MKELVDRVPLRGGFYGGEKKKKGNRKKIEKKEKPHRTFATLMNGRQKICRSDVEGIKIQIFFF